LCLIFIYNLKNNIDMRIIITENQLNDLLLREARFVSDEKYDFIIKNLGNLLFNELVNNPVKVNAIPEINRFKSFLKFNRNVEVKNDEDVVYNLDEIGDWLRNFSDMEFTKIMNGIFSFFPNVKRGVDTFNVVKRDPSLPPSRRGRPLGSTKKPGNKIIYSKVISRRPLEPKDVELEPQSMEFRQGEPKVDIEPKTSSNIDSKDELRKRGRKPKDDGFSNYERFRFQKEGPESIEKLENRALELDKQVDEIMKKIRSLYADADKRRKFFNMD
jgi:hypothetical protein